MVIIKNAIIKGHCLFQLGSFGRCEPPADPGETPGGGPGGK